MRILWISDSPTSPSGFGYVTRAICERLAKLGHHVEILGWQTYGKTSYWKGIPVHPIRQNMFGSDVLLGYLHRLRPNFIITLADVWWMAFLTEPPVQNFLDISGARWIHYYPVDGADADGKLPSGWVNVLKTVDLPVCMSNFGAAVSSASGIQSSCIPHGCDIDIFAPPQDKENAKARLGYGGKFVILSDARNQPRKLLPRLLDIFNMFAADKDDVILHLHADPFDDAAKSDLYHYELLSDIEALGLNDKVKFTENFRMRASGGISIEDLAGIYAASDVHLLCSWGEGFGLPNLQAASSGVVPISVAYSASQELVEGHGFAVQPESAMVDEFGLVRYMISREGAINALEQLYYDKRMLKELSHIARNFALSYSWDSLVGLWEQLLINAPQRRKPVRSRSIDWIGGEKVQQIQGLPDPVAEAVSEAFVSMPKGAKISINMAERHLGEAISQIRMEAFSHGDELSIPVRLPRFFSGAPRATVGYIIVSPEDLPLAVKLKRIFPGITVAIPRPEGDPQSTQQLPFEKLLPVIPHSVLAIDLSGTCAQNMDLACAALGVPYIGPSRIWPEISSESPLLQIRKLLTDQGFSEWRRRVAEEQMVAAFGQETLETIRKISLAGQPSPTMKKAKPPEMEMFLVRPKVESSPDSYEQIGEYVSRHGGLVLMATSGGSLFVAISKGGKEILQACPQVGFVGGVHFDGDSKAARALKKRFAINAAKQMASGLYE